MKGKKFMGAQQRRQSRRLKKRLRNRKEKRPERINWYKKISIERMGIFQGINRNLKKEVGGKMGQKRGLSVRVTKKIYSRKNT